MIALAFLLLLVAFRSLLVPVQAAVTNLLSVARRARGAHGDVPVGMGAVAIGLDAPSGNRADRELRAADHVRGPLRSVDGLRGVPGQPDPGSTTRGRGTRRGRDDGAGAAAPVVTAAALIMFCVFASFIVNGDPTVKQFGVGLAIAVALAGILIVTLAPAVLVLFGAPVLAPAIPREGPAAPRHRGRRVRTVAGAGQRRRN